jgi:hypothetical protein
VKTRTPLVAVLLVVAAAAAVSLLWFGRDRSAPHIAAPPGRAAAITGRASPVHGTPTDVPPPREPLPGQGHAVAEATDAAGGVISGRVINTARGDGVAGAELTFVLTSGTDGGASTVRSRDDGSFELAPPAPGQFVLSAVAAPGFLPYAPELSHSTVHVALAAGQIVRGVIVFLTPALDYRGTVVDARGAPAPGARVRLIGTPTGEQAIDKPQTEWTADRDGVFVFHAADDAVLEATRGAARGWAVLDSNATITRQLTITLGDGPARDATITGRVIDATGAPLADALIRAEPSWASPERERRFGRDPDKAPRATAFATSGPDGSFVLAGLDRLSYHLTTTADDHAPSELDDIAGGTHGLTITLDGGLPLAGTVIDAAGASVPAFTLLVHRRDGIARIIAIERSIVEPRGRFSVRVARGDYELTASASGWGPSPATRASAGTTDVVLTLSKGATLRGTVVATGDGQPIQYARIQREANGGGASAQPSNAGTVTRADGSFELTGIPPGPLSITISAGDYHPKIEAAMTAVDGETLGPVTIALTRLAPGEVPRVELVGIGIVLAADGDALRVQQIIPQGGADAAGIVVGDRVVALDGAPVAPLGVDGAIAKIRGLAGTTIAVSLRRGDQPLELVVQRRKIRV